MLVDAPLSPSLSLAEYNTTDLSEYLNTDLFGPSIEGESSSSSSSASSPQSASLLTPPPQAPPSPPFTEFDSPPSGTLFNLLEDELKLDGQPSTSPFHFLSRYEEQPEPMGIDPQLMATPAEESIQTFKEEEHVLQPEPQPEPKQEKLTLTITPFKAGGHGKSRKGTVVNGGIVKKSVAAPTQVAAPVVVPKDKENIDDDDDLPADWRPPPEVFAKMSSKEKRQLRNKISARNFRVRRKEYISTLELDIAERDRLLQSVRDELGSTQSENVALRQEIAALKKALLEGRSNTELTTEDIPVLNLPPPGPIPTPTPAATVSHTSSPSPSLITANTQKDVASPRSGSFWGGASRMGSGITPVHTVLIPETAWAKPENINPVLNAEKRVKSPINPGFEGFTDNNLFTMKNLDMYRMHLWSKMASQSMIQQQPQYPPSPPSSAPSSPPTPNNPLFSPSPFTNPSLPLHSTPLHDLASFMGPKYFQTSHKANLPSPPSSPPMMSKTLSTVLSGKQSLLSQGGLGRKSPTRAPPMKEQEQALVAALAGQTLLKRLGGAFWDAFSGSESSSRKIDVDKVRRVLEGKAVVQIVDVDVEPRKEMGRKVTREACSVTAILEESMKSLTLGKK
ncbi:hypothetical protein EDD18DRAFT_1320912 [Armillaria luteobubalina]|uniref:BZIP domain-containing protein n=1 Tax=Armillaria luteobubalina TaxID=153913 RepID=A0AA39UM76_9AGAR|nr:hypothetical protein EDD18DRAFT_1320912 [Armillaria luteobubalina]